MKMRNAGLRTAFALLLFLAAPCAPALHAREQKASGPAPRGRVLAAIVYDGYMTGLLGHLAEEFGVNIGVETEPGQPRPSVKINLREATLQDVLDAVVQSQPAYRWRQEGDFVDVYPSKGGSPLLDTVVGNFQVNAASWEEASDALLRLPEVQSGMSAMRLSRREAERGTARGGEALTLYLENVPVRRALHELAKRSGSHIWVFRQYDEGEKTFTLANSTRCAPGARC
jgi:hypothetical protein